MNRREFLKSAGTGAVVAVGAAAADAASGQTPESRLQSLSLQRTYTASRYALELDGAPAGFVHSFEGGNAYATVVTEKINRDPAPRKHLGGVRYEEMTVQAGVGLAPPIYQWIQDFLAGKAARHDGAISAVDSLNRIASRMEFKNALLTEVTIPAADAASKETGYFKLKWQPEFTRKMRPTAIKSLATKQKNWITANFRLSISGLEDACKRVMKVEPLTVKQTLSESSVGEIRDYQKEPAQIEIPNLVIILAERDAEPFQRWFDDFVIRGNNHADREKGGTLEFLSPDLSEALFTLKFAGLGIFRLAPEKAAAGADAIRRVRAEMYCEDMTFQANKAAA